MQWPWKRGAAMGSSRAAGLRSELQPPATVCGAASAKHSAARAYRSLTHSDTHGGPATDKAARLCPSVQHLAAARRSRSVGMVLSEGH
ncbi:hypothetical protein GQ53DRAFT_740764 [Thozetella sp. PMI_491]|nr:hypothetical protein GQ53DRAFT_740764 [Thozetella sp. PMI_491]